MTNHDLLYTLVTAAIVKEAAGFDHYLGRAVHHLKKTPDIIANVADVAGKALKHAPVTSAAAAGGLLGGPIGFMGAGLAGLGARAAAHTGAGALAKAKSVGSAVASGAKSVGGAVGSAAGAVKNEIMNKAQAGTTMGEFRRGISSGLKSEGYEAAGRAIKKGISVKGVGAALASGAVNAAPKAMSALGALKDKLMGRAAPEPSMGEKLLSHAGAALEKVKPHLPALAVGGAGLLALHHLLKSRPEGTYRDDR